MAERLYICFWCNAPAPHQPPTIIDECDNCGSDEFVPIEEPFSAYEDGSAL